METAINVTATLDVLVRRLRSNDDRNPSTLQQALYFLTTVRNEQNIALLVNEIVHSSSVLPTPNTDLESTWKLIDGFHAAANRKLAISDPTIWPQRWAELILLICKSHASTLDQWRVLPVLVGLMLAQHNGEKLLNKKSQRDSVQEMIIHITNVCMANQQPKRSMVYFSLMKAHSIMDRRYFDRLDHKSVLMGTMELIYIGEQQLQPVQVGRTGLGCGFFNRILSNTSGTRDPIYTHLSQFSHFVKDLIEHVTDYNVLDQTLNFIIAFINRMAEEYNANQLHHSEQETWNLLKLCLFGLSIQLHGFATLLLTTRKGWFTAVVDGPYFASKIIQSLPPIKFVVLQLSSTGFEAYDYIYNVCIDVLLASPNNQQILDRTARILGGCVNIAAFKQLIDRGKIVYMLDFFELVVARQVSDAVTTDLILPIAREFLVPRADYEYIQPVLESAHSVVLAYLTALVNLDVGAREARKDLVVDDLILEYLDTSLSLIPDILSPTQLRLAVMTLMSVVSSPVYRAVNPRMALIIKERLFLKAQISPANVIVKSRETHGQNEEQPPETLRVVMVGLLIHCLPFCDGAHELERALDSVTRLIRTSSSDERDRLKKELWTVISGDIGLQLSDLAIRWWYSNPKL